MKRAREFCRKWMEYEKQSMTDILLVRFMVEDGLSVYVETS